MSDSSPDGSHTELCDCFNGASATGDLPNLRVMKINDQIRELQTIIRDEQVASYKDVLYIITIFIICLCAGLRLEVIFFSTRIDW